MPPEEFVQPAISIPGLASQGIIVELSHKFVALYPHLYAFVKATISFFVVISIPLSVFFLIVIIYCVERLKEIRKKEKQKFDVKVEVAFEETDVKGNRDMAVRWVKVNSLLNSANQNDWKQAILESDNMLQDLLVSLGYRGEGVGEMLKRVEPGEFKAIDDAWEAHKTRNAIAHDGAFTLTHHEAVSVIHKFRRVFEEFYYI